MNSEVGVNTGELQQELRRLLEGTKQRNQDHREGQGHQLCGGHQLQKVRGPRHPQLNSMLVDSFYDLDFFTRESRV